jgi:membrane peptidoglycan carboxypeptidase
MPAVTDIVRQRRARQAHRARRWGSRARAAGLSLTTLLSLGVAAAGITLTLAYHALTQNLPNPAQLPLLLHPATGQLRTPTTLTDRTGQVTLLTLGGGDEVRGAYLTIAGGGASPRFSPHLLNATLAAADPLFWQHPGYNPDTLLAEETDTIPLRLVSDLLLWEEPEGWARARRARLLAAQIVHDYGREQVLEWYLNSAHYGHHAFGADAAARRYFGVSAAHLTLAQAAALAAAALTPDLNPHDAPELALARRNETLNAMLSLGYIDAAQALEALNAPLDAIPPPAETPDLNTAFARLALAEAARRLPEIVLARGGFTIVTTLDSGLQAQFACTAQAQLARLAAGQTTLPKDCPAARLLPTLTAASAPAGLAAELVALDPLTGQVLAYTAADQTGRAIPALTGHPPGSLLTPFVYLSAFTRGYGPATLTWDIPASLPAGLNQSPNLDAAFHGPMRLRTALANDYLIPSLALLDQLGAANVWETAAQVGLTSLRDAHPPSRLTLEGGALPLLEAAHAFGALSTQGVLIGHADESAARAAGTPAPLRPTAVLRVVDTGGRVWLDPGPPQARPVTSAPLAYALTNILSDEPARWQSWGHPNALEIGRPAGVKTGFTQDGQNAWTVGYTPQMVVGVWVGAASPQAAAGLWHAALAYAVRDLPPQGWSAPQGISQMDVCDPSGQLPTIYCPVIVREIFLPGSEPTQFDTLYREFQINRETGLLATVFTPPALIEPRIYFVPPPEAADWAEQAGLDVPPENYDLVQPPPPSPEVRITSPEMFAYAGGEVVISGSAYGAGFASYSVQVGRGLNPQQWLQLGDASTVPEFDGVLARWDTAGLSGLYAIRLQVVRADNRLETHIVQITLDNAPPVVSVQYPADGQVFRYPADDSATFQFAAADDLLLVRVEVYVDGRLAGTFTQPPYALPWDLLPGEHRLRIAAYDAAGNAAEAEITFTVSR